jgi:hypothetical protein
MPPFLLIALAVVAVLLILRARQGGGAAGEAGRPAGGIGRLFGGGSKCSGCRHAKRIFDDGTLCTFGNRETFKNSVHVSNCVDHSGRKAH